MLVVMFCRFCGSCHRRRAYFSCGNLRDNRKWCILPFVYADFATAVQDSRPYKVNTTFQQ